ncbi:MAG: hypothetical protein H6565_13520 [Lewinellaceae bacterium]|nr:hypothetical protein [Saprospiraceae bacterium]MCB9307608.1 hypothetical protein [Lewinellaceae bacterium]MCB9354524.1 hypothetical protein [Lewinellaceae bacterium]
MRSITILLLLLTSLVLHAQQPDTLLVLPDTLATVGIQPDSAQRPHRFFLTRYFTDGYPRPGRAALLSLILPGTGQIYNKKWWKLPIVYGALGGMLWVEIDNIRQYRALRDNYKLLVDGDPDTNPTEAPYDRIDATSMKSYRDQWRRYVELSSLGLGLVYLLQVTDAFVDAHLNSFDVSDDLSLRFRPKLDRAPGLGPTFGVGLSLQFGRNNRWHNISEKASSATP